jgi:DNA-binding FadR family transcriptional regulator
MSKPVRPRRRETEKPASPRSTKAQPPARDRGRVIERLRALIADSGDLPGGKLPPERELARQLGVGRPAIREAIKALGILDVIESRRGAGTFIKAPERRQAGWPERASLNDTNFGMLELLEVRKMFEPRAAWLAAARASENDLRQIDAARRALEKAGDDWQRIAALDFDLHTAIVCAAGNPVLAWIHRLLMPVMLKSRSITARAAADRSRMHQDHRAIIDAIIQREPEAAQQAMLDHIHTIGMDLITEAPEKP